MLVVLGKQQVCDCSRYDIRLDISYEFSLHNNKNWSRGTSVGWYKGHFNP